jgi:hypothetical protein
MSHDSSAGGQLFRVVGNVPPLPSSGPYVPVASVDTLRRLLVYLGATPEQLEDFNRSYRRWGHGTVRITLLPGRKNLLRLRE